MIIEEKRLLAVMKARYKNTGYRVVTFGHRGEDWIGICPEGSDAPWYVLCERSNMPRKVMALIVEHAGDLPGYREAWYIVKGGPVQTLEHEYEAGLMTTMLAFLDDVDPDRMDMALMTLNSWRVWRNMRDDKLSLFNPLQTDLATGDGEKIAAGDRLCMRGAVSAVFVDPRPLDDLAKRQLEHLQKMPWS